METSAKVRRADLGYADADNNWYEASGWLTLPAALSGLRIEETDVFADLGCGKGRVLAQAAAMFPFARVIGVERSPEMVEAARANMALMSERRRLRAQSVAIEEADITEWEVPPDLTVAYMFNPFRGEVFAAAVQRLIASYDHHPRRLRIVYSAPKEHDALINTRRVRELPPPANRVWSLLGVDTAAVRRYEMVPDTSPGADLAQ